MSQISGNVSFGKMSFRQKVCSSKCPFVKMSFGKMSFGKMPFGVEMLQFTTQTVSILLDHYCSDLSNNCCQSRSWLKA